MTAYKNKLGYIIASIISTGSVWGVRIHVDHTVVTIGIMSWLNNGWGFWFVSTHEISSFV